jgi:hypothetical protein
MHNPQCWMCIRRLRRIFEALNKLECWDIHSGRHQIENDYIINAIRCGFNFIYKPYLYSKNPKESNVNA